MHALELAALVVAAVPTDKMLATLSRVDSIGPITHPTEWGQATFTGALAYQEALVEAAHDFRGRVIGWIEQMEGGS